MDNIFLQQLSLINGLSINAASAIVNIYPSVRCLMTAFDKEDQATGELLLANVLNGKKKIGPVLSKRVYEVYNKL